MSILKKNIVRIPLLCFFVLGLLVAWLGFGRHGFVHLYHIEEERQAYIAKINKLKEENQALFEEIRRLKTDPKHMEMVARRELGLVKSNEVIYRFKGVKHPKKRFKGKISVEKRPDEMNKTSKGEVSRNGTIK